MSAGFLATEAAGQTGQEKMRNDLLSNRLGIDPQILQFRQRRLDFQSEQQRLREQDRINAGQPKPRIELRRLKPNCQEPVSGNQYLRRDCR